MFSIPPLSLCPSFPRQAKLVITHFRGSSRKSTLVTQYGGGGSSSTPSCLCLVPPQSSLSYGSISIGVGPGCQGNAPFLLIVGGCYWCFSFLPLPFPDKGYEAAMVKVVNLLLKSTNIVNGASCVSGSLAITQCRLLPGFSLQQSGWPGIVAEGHVMMLRSRESLQLIPNMNFYSFIAYVELEINKSHCLQ